MDDQSDGPRSTVNTVRTHGKGIFGVRPMVHPVLGEKR